MAHQSSFNQKFEIESSCAKKNDSKEKKKKRIKFLINSLQLLSSTATTIVRGTIYIYKTINKILNEANAKRSRTYHHHHHHQV